MAAVPETAPTRGDALYDAAKLAKEAMLTAHCQSRGASACVLRPFSVYGPDGMKPESGHFIGTWLQRARDGQPLMIHGDGTQTIDLVHVSDLVAACALAERRRIAPGEAEVFNVGSGRDASVIEIAGWIRDEIPGVSIEHAPTEHRGIARRWADITKAREALGYEPAVDPEAGVRALCRE